MNDRPSDFGVLFCWGGYGVRRLFAFSALAFMLGSVLTPRCNRGCEFRRIQFFVSVFVKVLNCFLCLLLGRQFFMPGGISAIHLCER